MKYQVCCCSFGTLKIKVHHLLMLVFGRFRQKKNCEFITLIPEFTSEINTQYSPTIVMKKDTREKNKTKLS